MAGNKGLQKLEQRVKRVRAELVPEGEERREEAGEGLAKGFPIARRHAFEAIALAAMATLAQPEIAMAFQFDTFHCVTTEKDIQGSSGRWYHLIQYFYYNVEAGIYANRGKKVWVYKTLYQSGGIMNFTTRDEIYCNGTHVATIPRRSGEWRGPTTQYKNNPPGVSFMVYGGGSKRIQSREVDEISGTGITTSIDFTFTIPFIITASAGSNGSITSNGQIHVEPGASKGYTMYPSTGYHVSSVVVDGSNRGAITSFTFSNVWADHSISVAFAINYYTVRFLSGYGSNWVVKSQSVPHGGNATPPSVSREGYNFNGWSGSYTGVTGNRDVTAKWKIKTYTVTFKDGYSGKVLKTQTVNWGSNATAPAAPNRGAGWAFNGWDRGFTNVKSNITVNAKWRGIAKIFFYSDDSQLVYTVTDQTPGTAVPLPAAAKTAATKAGCTPGFTGWFSDSACTRSYTGGTVPNGNLSLYSYNRLTLSFAATSSSDRTDGTFREHPDGSAAGVTVIPGNKVVRYNRAVGLTVPHGGKAFRDEGDGHWATYRGRAYFGSDSSAGAATTSITPKRDTRLWLEWLRAVSDGVESTTS